MDNNDTVDPLRTIETIQPDLLDYISQGDRKLSDCSTSSAIAPCKTPKKVSFSDELPGSELGATEIAHPAMQSPMEYVLQQNHDYLNNLHRSAVKSSDEIDEIGVHGSTLNETAIFPNQRKESLHSVDNVRLSILKNSPNLDETKASANGDELTARRNDDSEIGTDKSVSEMQNGNRQRLQNIDLHHRAVDDVHFSSAMELEVRRDKKRWLLISECSVLMGDERHTREGFRKAFLDHVSFDFWFFGFFL